MNDNVQEPAELTFRAKQSLAESEGDPFRHAEVIPGLEHLGRGIVDENGQPSGSPANYEALRGIDPNQDRVQLRPVSEVAADIKTLFEREFAPGELDPTTPAE